MPRSEHSFEFKASDIAWAARTKTDYHYERLEFWQKEYDEAVATVEKTIGAKINKRPITGGYEVDVVINYGDPAAYQHMRRSFDKIQQHLEQAEQYQSDANLYATQGERIYELSVSDVLNWGLSNRPPENDD